MIADRLRTVALLARGTGMAVLKDALLGHPALELAAPGIAAKISSRDLGA